MRKSKLISLTLALALVLSTVFAGTESVFADTVTLPEGNITLQGTPFQDAAKFKAADDTTELTPVVAQNLNTVADKDLNMYTTTEYTSQAIYYAVEIPKAGNFIFDILSVGDTNVYLYEDLNDSYIDARRIAAAETTDDVQTFSVQVKKAGTYYLVFEAAYGSAQSAFTVTYAPTKTTTSSSTLKSNKDFYASVSGSGYRYYKVTTVGNRKLTISFPWGDGTNSKYKVKIMDSKKKKTLSGVTTVSSSIDYTTFGAVPKGTYYVAVSTATDSCYSIKVKQTKVTENSGSSKSKAKSISKGGKKKGLVTATQSKTSADWYKIKVNSNQAVNLDVYTETGGSGGIKITVYSGSKSMGSSEFYNGSSPDSYSGRLELYTTINGVHMGYLQKGTYYIKVTKYGSGNGYYEIQWK